MQTLKVKDNDIKFITKLINLNNMKYDDSKIFNHIMHLSIKN